MGHYVIYLYVLADMYNGFMSFTVYVSKLHVLEYAHLLNKLFQFQLHALLSARTQST